MSTSDATPTEPEPIAVGRLIAATWREAWRTWPVLWPAWLLSAGLQAPIEVTFRLARPAGEGPGGSFAERLANSGLSSFVGAVVLALVLPVLLRQQERIGRLSRGHVDVMRGYVLVMLGFSLVTELAWTGVEGLSLAPLPASAAGLAMLFVSFMGLAPWTLWNISQLPGLRRLTVAEAWRLGWSGAWAYAAAGLSVAIAPALIYSALIGTFDESLSVVALVGGCAVGGVLTIWETALGAAFYRQRLGLERSSLAEVFD